MDPDDAEWIEIDDRNEEHLAAHQVTAAEVAQVWLNGPVWARNVKGRTGTWRMVGKTDGGRPIVAAVVFDEVRLSLRPITARTCEPEEVVRWFA